LPEAFPTTHKLVQGDARNLSAIADGTIHLVVTSPPYWNLKRYNDSEGQLGHVADYDLFIKELEKVWREAFRVLVPGGRLVCVVGDVCLSRRENAGRHTVVPLHADICVTCRRLGFDNLNPIIWHKISNASYEVSNGSKFLGKPYEPNAIIKNDIEYILMQRKPGGYRKPTAEQRKFSMIPKDKFDRWFQQFWNLTGASTKEHPAPSFVGDTVLDPFCGTATTMVAALKTGRNSIGIELDTEYCRMAASRLMNENGFLFSHATIQIELQPQAGAATAAPSYTLQEKPTPYKPSRAPKNSKRLGNPAALNRIRAEENHR
jgi:site-specific DNA-methyltransferase (adenine-specific)